MTIKSKGQITIILVMCLAILAAMILTVPPLKEAAWEASKKLGLAPLISELRQKVELIIAKDYLVARQRTVVALHKAQEAGDFRQVALQNSILAQDAFERAYRTLKAWETLRDPETGLVPRDKDTETGYWSPQDTAADLFCFLLLASQYLDQENERLWLNTLASEREICGAMPGTIRFPPTEVVEKDLDAQIFGASEYAKDGLLAVAERSGQGAWFERLEEIMLTLIDTAYIEAESGLICASTTEVNGEMLQVLCRLYWATGKEEYLEMAERIGEAYLFDILPKNRYLPASDWDFSRGEPASPHFRLRDHGSEIIPGLAELYLLEKIQGRPQAESYRQPLKEFLDLILEVGRSREGLWYNTVDTKTHQVVDEGIVDTWGYILNAYQTFDIAEGASIYTEEIKGTMRAVATHGSFTREGWHHHDEYADSIESMLYLLPWFDIPECHRWVDDEIGIMFAKQSASGFVSEGYLDGNFIRTALLYATYKTRGVTAHPWREDIYLGAAYDRDKEELHVYLDAEVPWQGVLKFDLPRHSTIWNLPREYPRLNGTPEWFVVEPQSLYVVEDTGRESVYSGQALAQGLAISLDGESPLRLIVSVK